MSTIPRKNLEPMSILFISGPIRYFLMETFCSILRIVCCSGGGRLHRPTGGNVVGAFGSVVVVVAYIVGHQGNPLAACMYVMKYIFTVNL